MRQKFLTQQATSKFYTKWQRQLWPMKLMKTDHLRFELNFMKSLKKSFDRFRFK